MRTFKIPDDNMPPKEEVKKKINVMKAKYKRRRCVWCKCNQSCELLVQIKEIIEIFFTAVIISSISKSRKRNNFFTDTRSFKEIYFLYLIH